MKTENILSHQLNNHVLDTLIKVQENYPGLKTVIMNLKTISKELNEQTIKEIIREEEEK